MYAVLSLINKTFIAFLCVKRTWNQKDSKTACLFTPCFWCLVNKYSRSFKFVRLGESIYIIFFQKLPFSVFIKNNLGLYLSSFPLYPLMGWFLIRYILKRFIRSRREAGLEEGRMALSKGGRTHGRTAKVHQGN